MTKIKLDGNVTQKACKTKQHNAQYDMVTIRLPKGMAKIWHQKAKDKGMTLSELIRLLMSLE